MTTRLPLLMLAVIVFGPGCSPHERTRKPNAQEAAKVPFLTEDIARKALIKLVDGPGERETREFERLADLRAGGAIEFVALDAEGHYYGDFWAVCLERGTFTFCATRGVHTWRLDGVFRLDQNEWTAVVTKEMRGFHRKND